jgi:predicted acetyltransferase
LFVLTRGSITFICQYWHRRIALRLWSFQGLGTKWEYPARHNIFFFFGGQPVGRHLCSSLSTLCKTFITLKASLGVRFFFCSNKQMRKTGSVYSKITFNTKSKICINSFETNQEFFLVTHTMMHKLNHNQDQIQ